MHKSIQAPETEQPHFWPILLDVKAVATILNCSERHVYRLTDMGKMPAPVRLGALVRWDKSALEKWVANGCPVVRR